MLGAVTVTVRCSAIVNETLLVSTAGPAVSLTLTKHAVEGVLGTVQAKLPVLAVDAINVFQVAPLSIVVSILTAGMAPVLVQVMF